MKKIVVKLAMEDDNIKRKALKVVAGVKGVDSVAVDMKAKKITVIGEVDPVYLTSKLRKCGFTELLSVGPAKEEKKEPPKKEENKEGEKKTQTDAKKENKSEVQRIMYVPSSYDYRPHQYVPNSYDHRPHQYVPNSYDHRSYEYNVVSEENPNACTIS